MNTYLRQLKRRSRTLLRAMKRKNKHPGNHTLREEVGHRKEERLAALIRYFTQGEVIVEVTKPLSEKDVIEQIDLTVTNPKTKRQEVLQVKSSPKDAALFLKRHPKRKVFIFWYGESCRYTFTRLVKPIPFLKPYLHRSPFLETKERR